MSTFTALILKSLKSWFLKLVLVLVYLSPQKVPFVQTFFPHQIGTNWSNQLGKTTVPGQLLGEHGGRQAAQEQVLGGPQQPGVALGLAHLA